MEERGGERDPERFVFWGPRQCRAVPVPRALGRPPGRLPRKPRGPWTADEVRGPERSPQTAGASRVALSPLLITARRLGQWRRREGGEKPPTPTHTLPHLSQSLGTEPHLAAGEAWRWAQCRAAPALTLRPHQRGGCLLGQGSETLLPHPPTTQRTCRPPRPARGWSPPSMDGVEGRMWREMQITSAWPLQPLASPLGCQPTSLPLSAVLVAPSSVAPVLVPEGLREPLQ